MQFLSVLLAVWICGLLVVCSILQCWFFSSLPSELLLLARQLGWHKHDADFWPDHPEDAGRDQWIVWANMQVSLGVFPRRLVVLLTCPTCFAVHAAAYTALGTVLIWRPAELNAFVLWLGAVGSWVFPAVRLTQPKS